MVSQPDGRKATAGPSLTSCCSLGLFLRAGSVVTTTRLRKLKFRERGDLPGIPGLKGGIAAGPQVPWLQDRLPPALSLCPCSLGNEVVSVCFFLTRVKGGRSESGLEDSPPGLALRGQDP